jgi:hypothetical protein
MTLANTGSGVLAMKVPANGQLSLAGSDFQLTLVVVDQGGLAGRTAAGQQVAGSVEESGGSSPGNARSNVRFNVRLG